MLNLILLLNFYLQLRQPDKYHNTIMTYCIIIQALQMNRIVTAIPPPPPRRDAPTFTSGWWWGKDKSTSNN